MMHVVNVLYLYHNNYLDRTSVLLIPGLTCFRHEAATEHRHSTAHATSGLTILQTHLTLPLAVPSTTILVDPLNICVYAI